MKFEEWKRQEIEKRGDITTSLFFGRKSELAELKAFLADNTVRIFGLFGVPMIGKTTLVREFLKTIANREIQIIRFQNPENPENTLHRALSENSTIDWQTQSPKLIVLENFEEALQLRGNKDHLHEIKVQRIKQFVEEMAQLPFVKLILESRFQVKIDFVPGHVYSELKSKQLGGIDRQELYDHLNQIYRNNQVSYEVFEEVCKKFDDHVWLVEMAMQDTWEFEDVREAIQHPQSITQNLWRKLQGIIKRLPASQKTLLCAFAIVNPISEVDLERQLKNLPVFRKKDELENALRSLRKKLLAVYNVQNKSYELNPFLREVCFTFLKDRAEMKVLESLPYFREVEKPKYDRLMQAHEKGEYSTFFRLLKEKRRARKYDEVIDILQEAYWTNPKKEVILNEIGITYKWQKNWPEAKHYFERALEINPDDVKALNELAIIHKEQKNYIEAIRILKGLINKQHIPAYTELAIIYKECKKYDKAVRVLNKALDIDGKDVKTLNELAVIYKEQKNYDEALTRFEKLTEEYHHIPAYNELANLYKEQGEFDKALTTINKGLAKEPGNTYFRSTLRNIKRAQNDSKSKPEPTPKKISEVKNDSEPKAKPIIVAEEFVDYKNSRLETQNVDDEVILQQSHNEEILKQKESLLKEQKESLTNLNNLKSIVDENVNKRINNAKLLVCAYFVAVWLVTIILGRVIGWNTFEEWTFYIGGGGTLLGLIYLVINGEEMDVRKYFEKLKSKYYQEECRKLMYNDTSLSRLYEEISSLEKEIIRLKANAN
ncbi:MAG: tetratricopeptide repeat protein [Pyrinomonadaceae bacterium]|nr:tetratricopeptide repeat protein [Pyrinomonadaceae bacterium]